MVWRGNHFRVDDRWQREMRDGVLVPQFYDAGLMGPGPFIHCDPPANADDDNDMLAIQKLGVDVVMIDARGRPTTADEKIVREHVPDYDAFFLETVSCPFEGRETPGWMVYSKAAWLVYAMQRAYDLWVHLIGFQQLKTWFWQPGQEERWPVSRERDEKRHVSIGRIVKIAAIIAAGIPYREFVIQPDPLHPDLPSLFPKLARQLASRAALPAVHPDFFDNTRRVA
jgi:hypothetical protein